MEEKNITKQDAIDAIGRQSNEDEVTAVFRIHILRFWSRERQENFGLWLLGDEQKKEVKWLRKYKDAADEALSYLITNEKDAHAAKLLLNALNIGAHEQPPEMASSEGERDMSELEKQAYELCLAIEQLPAGEYQTKLAILASDLSQNIRATEQSNVLDCAYCHCTTVILSDGVHCINCGRVYKSHGH